MKNEVADVKIIHFEIDFVLSNFGEKTSFYRMRDILLDEHPFQL